MKKNLKKYAVVACVLGQVFVSDLSFASDEVVAIQASSASISDATEVKQGIAVDGDIQKKEATRVAGEVADKKKVNVQANPETIVPDKPEMPSYIKGIYQ